MAPGNVVSINDLPDEIRFPVLSEATNIEDDTSKLIEEEKNSNIEHWTSLLSKEVKEGLEGHRKISDNYYQELLADFEKTIYTTALKVTKGKRIACAKILNVGRNTES